MNQREDIESQIREILARETTAFAVSQQLFHPTGLFSRLAATEADRREVARSALFVEAQRRLSELQRKEGAAFSQTLEKAQPPILRDSLVLRRFDAVVA